MMIFLPIIGVAVGFISGFFGIGGGTIIVPVMLAFGYPIKTAIGVSVLQMLMSAIFGSYFNYKNADFTIKSSLALSFGALGGASLSGFIVVAVPDIALKYALLTGLGIAIAKTFYFNPNAKSREIGNLTLFLVGFGVSMVAISMGIGGAIFLTPILSAFLGMDIKKAVSLGLFFVIFGSFSGLISLSAQGLVDYKAGFALGLGSLLGVYFGTKLHHAVSKNTQKNWLLALYIFTFLLTLKSIIFG